MSDRNTPNIRIEKISLERLVDVYEAFLESRKEWFAEGMIYKMDASMHEFESWLKALLELWEKDAFYMFDILEAATDQILGFVLLNHLNRTHQIANLGYMVRTSRAGQGIATAATRLAARYGFEQLGLQRIEIVVRPDNPASLKVAEKAGAVREALLRNRLRHHGSPCDAYMHSLIPADLGIV
jgi:RimJ/RimL family protein N-acetyltransferase